MLSEIAASAEELATRPDTPASIAELMLMGSSVLYWRARVLRIPDRA
jgi:hypothetical protein